MQDGAILTELDKFLDFSNRPWVNAATADNKRGNTFVFLVFLVWKAAAFIL